MKCLVVCDSIPMTRTIEEFAGQMNSFSKPRTALDTNTAIQEMNKYSFDYVVLVMSHPKDANLELLKWIRGEGVDVEIIVISSISKVAYIKRTFGFGICDYIIKPITFERFKQSITRAIGKSAYLSEYKYLSQAEVDHYIGLASYQKALNITDKKGIAPQTLKKIEDIINTQNAPFTAGALATKTKLSRITVRRYLESMVEKGLLFTDYIYGEIGRPQKVYKKTDDD